jgi:emericellamide synthase (highly reducing iterative type I polyketide synthase)
MLKWPENTIHRASVNSFGYGGTNAHVILESAEDYLNSMKNICSLACKGGVCSHATTQTIIAPDLPPEAEPTTHTNDFSTLQHRRLKTSSTINITKPRLFPFSHNHEGGIAKLAASFKRFVSDNLHSNTDEFLDSLAFTLSDRRSFLGFRSSVAASTCDELVDRLEEIATGSDRAQKYAEQPKICFVFTGMTIRMMYANMID